MAGWMKPFGRLSSAVPGRAFIAPRPGGILISPSILITIATQPSIP